MPIGFKFTELQRGIVVAKAWAKRGMGSQCFMDIEVQLRVMTKLWRRMVVMGHSTVNVLTVTELCTENDSSGEAYVTYILPQ